MSGLWVAVTAEFNGSTFSHRATGEDATWEEYRVVGHRYNLLLDEAGHCVRRGLRGAMPAQESVSEYSTLLSDREKLVAIRKILDASSIGGQEIIDIYEVLDR